jgi:hypothetical protein
MADAFERETPSIEEVERYGAFTLERTHIPRAPMIRLVSLCLRTTRPDGISKRITIRSGLLQGSWTLEFVARNVIIWLRGWERQQIKYPPAPRDQSREAWRYDAVEAALHDLMHRYPALAAEDFSYLTACSAPDPNAWATLSPRERAKRFWWLWDKDRRCIWEGEYRVERVLGEQVGQVGAFDLHAVRLRRSDGCEEETSWYEFVLRVDQRVVRLLCTSWWSGAPGTVSLDPAKTVEEIEGWLGSLCLDIATGLEYAARYADDKTRAQILEGVAMRQAQYDAVWPAWRAARTAHPGPRIRFPEEPDHEATSSSDVG